MLALLTPIDYGVLGLFLAAFLGMGAYFSTRQKDTGEFFLAGRSLGWLPLSLSLTAIFISLIGFAALPAAAYDHGWSCWIVVLALWIGLPPVAFVAIPIYRGLGVASLYEYLEHRFSPDVRLAASLLFVAWRLAWLVAAIGLSCEAIRWAAGWSMPAWLIAIGLGLIATTTAFLGGLRCGAWGGVLKASAMFAGAAAVVIAVLLGTSDGPERVAEVTRGLGRFQPAELNFSWNDPWTLWGTLPFWVLTVLTFFVADQAAAQRLLAAKTENLARTTYLACALALSLLLPALVFAGTCLLAFYYDHPQEMRPEWVVNVDGKTRLPWLDESGQPLLDQRNPSDAVTFENIDRLVAEGRILQPNNKEPFASADGLVDPKTNEIAVEKLAMRRPNSDRLRGEIIVRRDAPAEMLPHFARRHLSWGAAGLVLAALIATVLAAVDAGLTSISTVVVRDLVIRFGWGRAWLARRAGNSPDQLSTADELQLARPLTLVVGATATMLAAATTRFASVAGMSGLLVGFSTALGAPLLAVILLGMFTRRSTAAAALIGLVVGLLSSLALLAAVVLPAANPLTADYPFEAIWPAIGSFALAAGVGYGLSFLAGSRKTNAELRGLVVGCGELGRRASDEPIPLISVPEESDEIRWK